MNNVDKKKLKAIYDDFKIPPNVANIRVEGTVPTVAEIKSGFLKAGLTAADLTPIDWRKKIKISPVKNQQSCGDCWAMSSTSALTDRFIAQKGIDNLVLVPAITAQCVNAGPQQTINEGCEGGLPYLAGLFFENVGVPAAEGTCPEWEKSCGGTNCELPKCDQLKQMCNTAVVYKAKKGSTKNLAAQSGDSFDTNTTIANIKKELLNGPITACYFVQVDFMASVFYKWEATNGIYVNGAYGDALDKVAPDKFKAHFNNPTGDQWGTVNAGAHAIEVVGWDIGDAGKNGKVPYWIVKNSWGPDWNEGGYFKIAMSDGGLNKNIGFDVPINVRGQQFGGMVSFDPDLSTGADGDHKYPSPGPAPPGPGYEEAKNAQSNMIRNILIAVVVILIFSAIGTGIYYWYKNNQSYQPPLNPYIGQIPIIPSASMPLPRPQISSNQQYNLLV